MAVDTHAPQADPRLIVDVAGLRLRSPCILASSVLTGDLERIRRAAACGAAAVSTKMAMVGAGPRAIPDVILRQGSGGIISPGDRRLTVRQACDLVRAIKTETELVVFANLLAPADDEPAWQRAAEQLQDAGADAVELDLSCPNLPGVTSRRSVAQCPVASERITRAVKTAADVPVFCKLTAQVADIGEIARACEHGGADGIVAINGLAAVPDLDLHGGGRPRYRTLDTHCFGALTGSPLFPIACRAVADVTRSVGIPVVGCGGVSTWEDAVQMMMWGATAVPVCTAVLTQGFEVLRTMNRGMADYLAETGHDRIDRIVGTALRRVVPAEEVSHREFRPVIDRERCTLCLRCLRPGICLALSEDGGGIELDAAKCLSCGVCAQVCPHGAIAVREHLPLAAPVER